MEPDSQIELLSIVAHDLKAPIGAVMGYIELIQQSGPLNDRQQRFSERALSGLKQMQQLVSDILDVAWIDTGAPLNLTDCDIGSVLRDSVVMIEPLADNRQITVHVDIQSKLGLVMGDSLRLTQVMDNLLSNAIKYNHDGGQIWVVAANEQNFVRVSVRDTGIGIPEEDQPLIFERFFRSPSGVRLKIEGSGLGLAITKAIVEKHNGHIMFESMAGKGSVFSFTLPRKAARVGEWIPEAEYDNRLSESRDRIELRTVEDASEEMDPVDDRMQESPDLPSIDSNDDNP